MWFLVWSGTAVRFVVVGRRGLGRGGAAASKRGRARWRRSEVLLRFSSVAGERGSPDTWRDPRGFALRLYTGEGSPVLATSARCRHSNASTRQRVGFLLMAAPPRRLRRCLWPTACSHPLARRVNPRTGDGARCRRSRRKQAGTTRTVSIDGAGRSAVEQAMPELSGRGVIPLASAARPSGEGSLRTLLVRSVGPVGSLPPEPVVVDGLAVSKVD